MGVENLNLQFTDRRQCGRDDALHLQFDFNDELDGPDYDFEGELTILRGGSSTYSCNFAFYLQQLSEFGGEMHDGLLGRRGVARLAKDGFFSVAVIALGHPASCFTAVCTVGSRDDRDYCIFRGFSCGRPALSAMIRQIKQTVSKVDQRNRAF